MSYTEGLLQFIEKSPSTYHVIENMGAELKKAGYVALSEKEKWDVKAGGSYYVTRNGSSIIAFTLPEGFKGFHIIASHSDSPTFKVKESAEMNVESKYIKLNTEKYGGMIHSTWLDRALSVAGRVAVKNETGEIVTKTVNVDKDLFVIPNLAIHMNREINSGFEYNAQTDMLPLMGICGEEYDKNAFMEVVAKAAGVKPEDILGHDLFLYVREAGKVVGLKDEFVLSPKLDDLQCAYTSMQAFVESTPKNYANVLAVFDNEEVGSGTMQGADSSFLADVIARIGECLNASKEDQIRWVAESFLVSADNAHAVHPNHPEKCDPTNRPYINGGIVIKYHGSQKYTTDAVSGAKMKDLCDRAGVPFQTFANRSDMVGGSTLGNISTAHVSVSSVDIGLPQLSMHSAMETAGCEDTENAVKVFKVLFGE